MGDNDRVPQNSFKVPFKTRILINALQFFNAALASKFLTKFFFTPVNFNTPERESPFKHKCALHREKIGNKRITIYHYGQHGPNVLFSHGWSGRGTQFYKIAEALVEKGFRVTLFTAPAHGSSDDTTTDLLEFVESIKFINSKFGPFTVGIGHSLGGVAMINAFSQGVAFEGIVTIGTPATTQSVIDDFCRLLGANDTTKALVIKHLENRYQSSIETYGAAELLKSFDVPGLIIHDTDDADCAVQEAYLLDKEWRSAELFITKALGHRKILGDPSVVDKICEFVSERQ